MATVQDRPPPTTAAIALASALVAGTIGYFIGQASSIGVFGSSPSSRSQKKRSKSKSAISSTVFPAAGKDGEKDKAPEASLASSTTSFEHIGTGSETETDDEVDSEEESGELKTFEENAWEDCKMVLVVRTDLGMTKGKIAAQASHATLACYRSFQTSAANHPLLARWMRSGQMKVAVQCKSEDEMDMLYAQALSLGLCARVIQDAGRTQIAAGSRTVLGIGPGPKSVVERVTGGLKLL